MTMLLQQRIVDAPEAKPGQKAAEPARTLDASRTDINKALPGHLKRKVVQDRGYRWSLAAGSGKAVAGDCEGDDRFTETGLARLCAYHLACLGHDDAGVLVFMKSKHGEPAYAEVTAIPRSSGDLAGSAEARTMLGRKRTERGRYGLYFGYPTHVAKRRFARSGREDCMVEPVLLFPMEQEGGGERLMVDLGFPIITQKPFAAFTNVGRDMLMNELALPEGDLGFGGSAERPCIGEIAMRLRAVRPEWPWKEEIDPDSLGQHRRPLSEIGEAGIQNRAVILLAEKSPYTQGLEKELRDLAKPPARSYAGTALGRWLEGSGKAEDDMPPPAPLLEVLPMNAEQRQAVSAALTRPVTIITGPPGTGESQVVTNLLVNAAWSGKRVLFASKNNKAVDVVRTRVNARGPRPILLRVGARANQAKLADHVLALLSSTTSEGEREDFAPAKAAHERLLAEHARLAEVARRLVALRNETDRLEQLAEDARDMLGPRLLERIARHSHMLWKLWLRLRPSMLSAEERQQLGRYTSLLHMLAEAVHRDDSLTAALLQRGFIADTVHRFQGDERDVMIFSPVVAPGLSAGALGFLEANGNLFNVAITRARAQLIVVGDRDACCPCDVGYLSRFAACAASLEQQAPETAENLTVDFGRSYPDVVRPELVSNWERAFYVAAHDAGLRLIPLYPIEKYVVDFLMVEGARKLVVEVDGERYHRNWTGELCRRHQLRNQRLFELGYDVMRFWVCEVRDDIEGCLQRLRWWQSGRGGAGLAAAR